jgi:glycosyltransferase involved in cell wall biosynthesis
LRTPEDALVVCSVGSLTHRKGHDILLRALAEVAVSRSDVIGWVAGPADLEPGYAKEVAALAEELGLADRVRLLGHRVDVPDLLAACDSFALASRYEGFGLVLAEAMAAGKPVVATTVGASGEVVADGETGLLVPSEDAHALAEALLSLASDPERCREMGRAGRRRVDEHFTIEAAIRTHADLYSELVASEASRRP